MPEAKPELHPESKPGTLPETLPAAPAVAKPPGHQPRNPLHGLTLERVVLALVECYGWQGLAERVPVRCFMQDPSIKSSLTFLRRTPWAREKVESLYLFMLREQQRRGLRPPGPGSQNRP